MSETPHDSWMDRALTLGETTRIDAPPLPWIGCLVVKNNQLIGEGVLENPEQKALEKAGGQAAGATLYTPLEPSPSAAQAISQAKIETVVLALKDPDHLVAGKGIEALKKAGVLVVTRVKEKKATQMLEPYLHSRSTKTPFCWLKISSSLDGKVAAKDGSSHWITSPEAQANGQLLRAESQAILIGAGTAKVDKPHLTVHDVAHLPAKAPLRVVLDAWGELPLDSPLCMTKDAPTILYTTSAAPSHSIRKIEEKGVEIVRLTPDLTGSGVDLALVLKDLTSRGVIQLLIEGGGKVFSRFLERNLWQRLTIYFGPRFLGPGGASFFLNNEIRTIEKAPTFKLLHRFQLGDTIRADYERGKR